MIKATLLVFTSIGSLWGQAVSSGSCGADLPGLPYLESKFEFRRYPLQAPYARVGEAGVQYNGPAVADAPPGPELIGIFGPDAEELDTSLAAAIAACGGRYSLTGVSSNVQWGKASNELVKLIYDDHALAVITVGRDASHLAEQLALKAFLPVIAISADRSLTSANIPWIFRLPPKTAVANALRLVIDAAEQSGANRQRLREILISRPIYAGKAQFDSTGEMRAR